MVVQKLLLCYFEALMAQHTGQQCTGIQNSKQQNCGIVGQGGNRSLCKPISYLLHYVCGAVHEAP